MAHGRYSKIFLSTLLLQLSLGMLMDPRQAIAAAAASEEPAHSPHIKYVGLQEIEPITGLPRSAFENFSKDIFFDIATRNVQDQSTKKALKPVIDSFYPQSQRLFFPEYLLDKHDLEIQRGSAKSVEDAFFLGALQHIANKVDRSAEPVLVYDIGCGNGATTALSSLTNADTVGCEMFLHDADAQYFGYLLQNMRDIRAELNIISACEFKTGRNFLTQGPFSDERGSLFYQDNQVDVALALNFLHMFDPAGGKAFVQNQLHRILKPEGVAFVSVDGLMSDRDLWQDVIKVFRQGKAAGRPFPSCMTYNMPGLGPTMRNMPFVGNMQKAHHSFATVDEAGRSEVLCRQTYYDGEHPFREKKTVLSAYTQGLIEWTFPHTLWDLSLMARNLAGEFNLLRPQETNDENVSQWLIVARKKAERAVESAAAASAADSSAASIEKAFQEVTLSSHS